MSDAFYIVLDLYKQFQLVDKDLQNVRHMYLISSRTRQDTGSSDSKTEEEFTANDRGAPQRKIRASSMERI